MPPATRRTQSISTPPPTFRWRIPSKSTARSSGTCSAFSTTRMVRLPAAWVRAKRSLRSRRRLEETRRTEPRSPSIAVKSFGSVLALGDDAHIVLERQCSGRTCPEDGLIIRENDSIHRYRRLLPGSSCPAIPISVDCSRRGAMSKIRTNCCVDGTFGAETSSPGHCNFLKLDGARTTIKSYVGCLEALSRSIKGYA